MEASRRVLFAGAIGIVLCIILSSFSSFALVELQFGYYKLAMQWPISYCNIGIRCKGTVGDDFKIHGLWPFWANDTIVKSPCPGEEMPPISVDAVHGAAAISPTPARPILTPHQIQFPKHQGTQAAPALQIYLPPHFVAGGQQPIVMPSQIPLLQPPFITKRPISIPGFNGLYSTKFP